MYRVLDGESKSIVLKPAKTLVSQYLQLKFSFTPTHEAAAATTTYTSLRSGSCRSLFLSLSSVWAYVCAILLTTSQRCQI